MLIIEFFCCYQIVEDVSGEDFIAILKPSQLIVTGNVVTSTPEHLQTLKVRAVWFVRVCVHVACFFCCRLLCMLISSLILSYTRLLLI